MRYEAVTIAGPSAGKSTAYRNAQRLGGPYMSTRCLRRCAASPVFSPIHSRCFSMCHQLAMFSVPLTTSGDSPRSSCNPSALHADSPSRIDLITPAPPWTRAGQLNAPTRDAWNACGFLCLLTKRRISRAGALAMYLATSSLRRGGGCLPTGTRPLLGLAHEGDSVET